MRSGRLHDTMKEMGLAHCTSCVPPRAVLAVQKRSKITRALQVQEYTEIKAVADAEDAKVDEHLDRRTYPPVK